MPVIQVRDVPDHIYRLLAERAEQERRSLAQQVVAVLARGLQVDLDPRARRRALLESIQSNPPTRGYKASDPARLIREDRRRLERSSMPARPSRSSSNAARPPGCAA
jgi:hypothetical protein